MIRHPAFSVEPWCLRETELHLDVLAQTESVFALSNPVGIRAYQAWLFDLDGVLTKTADVHAAA